MTAPLSLPLRVAAVASLASLVGALTCLPATAASNATDPGAVRVTNTETVQVYTDAVGAVDSRRIYEQLALTGTGSVEVRNPVDTDGLRNLDGFGGFDVVDGEQVARIDVDGAKRLRTVSDYDGRLPLDVKVEYLLDGKQVEPGDVVGESGTLEVRYTVKNITGAPQELTFDDGKGGTVTKTVDVPIPLIGQLTTVAPPSFTDVSSGEANMAGDGKGGTKLSFTLTLLQPIGSDTAEFGYTAKITDGVIPRASIQVLPVNPLESPSFKSAGESYKGGADTGIALTDGAGQIDGHLLELRDGAGQLLAGLIKLRDGADKLDAGLSGVAAPGAKRLADGAGELRDGIGNIDDGAGKLADGSGALAAGTGAARTGSRQLAEGLGLISGGLGKLADENEGLPAAKTGATQLKQGVDLLIEKMGDDTDPTTFIGGLAKLEAGLGQLQDGAGRLSGGLGLLRGDGSDATPGLVKAKGGVDQVKAGLDDALKQGGSLAQLEGGLKLLNDWFCANYAALGGPDAPAAYGGDSCSGLVKKLQAGAAQSRTNLGAASAGLGQVSAGLGTALGALDTQLIPGANQLSAGLADAKAGAGALEDGAVRLKNGMRQVSGGLTQLADGLAAAVNGVLRLSNGSQDAYAGSTELADGLGRLDDGAHRLADGSGQLADGTGRAADGANQVADGAGRLSDGLGDAADGSGKIADGLRKAAAGAPKLKNGAQRLSDEGMSKLVDAGQATAQNYGEMYAVVVAGAERAKAEKMVYGAPKGAMGLAAYSYEIKGEDGEGGRNVTRGLGGVAVLAAGAAAFALRRRIV